MADAVPNVDLPSWMALAGSANCFWGVLGSAAAHHTSSDKVASSKCPSASSLCDDRLLKQQPRQQESCSQGDARAARPSGGSQQAGTVVRRISNRFVHIAGSAPDQIAQIAQGRFIFFKPHNRQDRYDLHTPYRRINPYLRAHA